MAHSCGNVLVGQACKHLTDADVTKYILCQAAVPANGYDEGNTVPRLAYLFPSGDDPVRTGFPRLGSDVELFYNVLGNSVLTDDELPGMLDLREWGL